MREKERERDAEVEFFDRSIETSKRASTSSDASLCWHQSPLFSDPHFFLEATEALGFTGEAPTALLERVERVDWGMISETIISEKKNGKCGRPSCLSWRPLFAARGSPRDSLVFFFSFFSLLDMRGCRCNLSRSSLSRSSRSAIVASVVASKAPRLAAPSAAALAAKPGSKRASTTPTTPLSRSPPSRSSVMASAAAPAAAAETRVSVSGRMNELKAKGR